MNENENKQNKENSDQIIELLRAMKQLEKGTRTELTSEEKESLMQRYLNLDPREQLAIFTVPGIFSLFKKLRINNNELSSQINDKFYYTILKNIKKAKGCNIPDDNISAFYSSLQDCTKLLEDEELFAWAPDQIQDDVMVYYIMKLQSKKEEPNPEKNRIIVNQIPCSRLKYFVETYPMEEDTNKSSFVDMFFALQQKDDKKLKEIGFSFSKAVIYLSQNKELSPKDFIKTLEQSYPEQKEQLETKSSSEIYSEVLTNNYQKIIKLSSIDEELKSILPDLQERTMPKEDFISLTNAILNKEDTKDIPIEYINLFLTQLSKQITENNNLASHNFSIKLINPISGGVHEYSASTGKSTVKVNAIDISNSKVSILKSIEAIFHEERHYYQRNQEQEQALSIENLLYTIETILGKEYYQENYYDINSERDARRASKLQTYAFLRNFNQELANKYKMRLESESYKEDRENLKGAIDPQEEMNLVQKFIETTSPKQMIEYRDEHKVLTYITDKNGSIYSPEIIEEKMEEADKKNNPETYWFYRRYLDLLTRNVSEDKTRNNSSISLEDLEEQKEEKPRIAHSYK